MKDMLVKLYDLPPLGVEPPGVCVRRALSLDAPEVRAWVGRQFPRWVPETEAAFCREPVSCFVAQRRDRIVGFACYEATCKNFFGPTGVEEAERGRGIGRALLLSALHAERALGYAYCIIGGVGDAADFYRKVVDAREIPGSTPGIYRHTWADPSRG